MFHFIEQQKVIRITGSNDELVAEFSKHIQRHPDNACIDEFGIGTNLGITDLYGLNSVFEERHVGLHIGLGGREKGSHHLDLLFSGGDIFCDNQLIFQNGKYLPKFIQCVEALYPKS